MNKDVMHSDYDGHPETVENDKELSNYLSKIAEDIGWIVIYFNSLEDVIAQSLREMMLRDPYQDERLDVFLAELGYQAKARVLIHLYGQAVTYDTSRLPAGELIALEKALTRAATIRNEYAHADWIDLRTGAYIKVKTRSSRNGVIHRYKRIDKKTARLDIEFIKSLRDRLEAVHELVEDQIYNRVSSTEAAERALPELKAPSYSDTGASTDAALDDMQSDILNALLALGYPAKDAQDALRNLPSGACVTDGIKFTLQTLMHAEQAHAANDIKAR
jgi:hypothetical protein